MLYLLDANVLIDANRDYYPMDRVPEFWEWIAEMGRQGNIKIPLEIWEEMVSPRPSRPDVLVEWLTDHRNDLLLDEEVSVNLVAQVTEQRYAADLTEDEIGKVGRDPFLIAYALPTPSLTPRTVALSPTRGRDRAVREVIVILPTCAEI